LFCPIGDGELFPRRLNGRGVRFKRLNKTPILPIKQLHPHR